MRLALPGIPSELSFLTKPGGSARTEPIDVRPTRRYRHNPPGVVRYRSPVAVDSAPGYAAQLCRFMPEFNRSGTIARGLLGAAVGGCLGYFAFFWIASQGFYALIIPPGLLGYAAGLFARRRSTLLAYFCGAAGLLLSLFTEWRFAPFFADDSLLYFIAHIHRLKPLTLIMLALGTFFSYRLALGRDPESRVARPDRELVDNPQTRR